MSQPRRFYGHGIPRVNTADLGGKLIVVEGADGAGRSTQVANWWTGWKPAVIPRCRLCSSGPRWSARSWSARNKETF